MSSEDKEKFITVREAAKECGRNMETVRRWIWAGKLPAEKLGNQLFIKRSDLASYCRETALKYRAEPEAGRDLIERAGALREQIRARIGRDFTEDEIVGEIHRQREERMNRIEESLKETTEAVHEREAVLNFLKKARAIRNKIHARTGEVFDAEAMIRELREEREHELE
jgi:excisionase family DNA binding protein